MKSYRVFRRFKALRHRTLIATVFLVGMCTPLSAWAQSCQKSTDCAGIMVCDNGQCRKAGSTGASTHALCTTDAQCGAGKACQNGACTAAPPPASETAPDETTPAETTVPPATDTAPPAESEGVPSEAAPGPGDTDTDAPSPTMGASSTAGSPELEALRARREDVSLVAPILLMGIGAGVMIQGGVLIALNGEADDPADTLAKAGAVILGGGGVAFIIGAALLPVRLSKRRSLDAQIEALEARETSWTIAPAIHPETRLSPGFYGATISGSF